MLKFFKKIFLFIFFCTLPSTYAMQEPTNIFSRVYGIISRFFSTYPVSSLNILQKYKFHKKSAKHNPLNVPKQLLTNNYYIQQKNLNRSLSNNLKITSNITLRQLLLIHQKESYHNTNTFIAFIASFLTYLYTKKTNEIPLNIPEKSLPNNSKLEADQEKIQKTNNILLLNILKESLEGNFKSEKNKKYLEIIKNYLLSVDPNLELKMTSNAALLPLLITQYEEDALLGYFIENRYCNILLKEEKNAPTGWCKKIIKTSKIDEANWKKIEKCILQGADPNLKVGPQKTPILNIAIAYKQHNLVTLLLQKNADPNKCDSNKKTSLYILLYSLSENGEFAEIEMKIFENLLQHKVDCNEYRHFLDATCGGWPPQYKNISAEIIKRLIQHGAPVNPNDSYRAPSPLKLAISKNNISLVEFLIERNANLDSKGLTPLCWSIIEGEENIPITKLLIKKGADVNEGSETPLELAARTYPAARTYNEEIIKDLCLAGAFLETRYLKGTVFHILAADNNKNAIETALIHANPSFDNKKIINDEYEDLRENLFNLFIFRYKPFNNIPLDIQKKILSDVLSKSELSHCILYKKLYLVNDKRYYIVAQVHKHIKLLEKLLQKKDDIERTALQLLIERHTNQDYIKTASQLLNINELSEAYNDFNEKFPTMLEENLICKIYKAYEQKTISHSDKWQ